MENRIREIIEKVKSIVVNYSPENVYKESFIDNDNVLYYSVTLWGNDDKRDLGFYIEWYKNNKQLLPVICNTRKYILHETLNLESVETAINELHNHGNTI